MRGERYIRDEKVIARSETAVIEGRKIDLGTIFALFSRSPDTREHPESSRKEPRLPGELHTRSGEETL
jgi:hypothetical protein